jgi:iron transport multicopper oxidase
MGQYPDGLRGPLIVHDLNYPHYYDDEFVVTLTDWYHGQMSDLLLQSQSQSNEAATGGEEPLPDNSLINESKNTTFKVQPNKTYLVHIICIGNWPGHAIMFEDHDFTLVELDGVNTEQLPVGSKNIRLTTGQRMSILLYTKNDTSRNYAVWNVMDINMMFLNENRTIPSGYNPNGTAWLVYDETKPLPPQPVLDTFDFVDDVTLVPFDREPLLSPVDHQIIMVMDSAEINGVNRFVINNQTYIPQKVPSLYTALTVGPEYFSNPAVYGQVNPYVINYGEVVEIVVNNHHPNLHPWHLHGHQFQVVQRSGINAGDFTGYFQNVSATPARRDTIMIENTGHVVIRFNATNPDMSPHFPILSWQMC